MKLKRKTDLDGITDETLVSLGLDTLFEELEDIEHETDFGPGLSTPTDDLNTIPWIGQSDDPFSSNSRTSRTNPFVGNRKIETEGKVDGVGPEDASPNFQDSGTLTEREVASTAKTPENLSVKDEGRITTPRCRPRPLQLNPSEPATNRNLNQQASDSAIEASSSRSISLPNDSANVEDSSTSRSHPASQALELGSSCLNRNRMPGSHSISFSVVEQHAESNKDMPVSRDSNSQDASGQEPSASSLIKLGGMKRKETDLMFPSVDDATKQPQKLVGSRKCSTSNPSLRSNVDQNATS